MRFSENGFYIERYVKCANCGLLIYDEGLAGPSGDGRERFCSKWCIEWADLRASGKEYWQLRIVQPTIKTSR